MVKVKTFFTNSFLSNCYVVFKECGSEIIVIDPTVSEALYSFLDALLPQKVILLLTHEHFDHTTGVNEIKKRYNTELICIRQCADKIAQKRNNRPLSLMGMSHASDAKFPLYECFADKIFDGESSIDWLGDTVRIIPTPGHTSASCCILVAQYAFTGDSALLGIPTITRFPTGNATQYASITVPFLKSLDSDTIVMPGHGESFTINKVKWTDNCFQMIDR